MNDRTELAQLKQQIKDLKTDLKKHKTKAKIRQLEKIKKDYRRIYNRILARRQYPKNAEKQKQAVLDWRGKNQKKYNEYMKQLMRQKRMEKKEQ